MHRSHRCSSARGRGTALFFETNAKRIAMSTPRNAQVGPDREAFESGRRAHAGVLVNAVSSGRVRTRMLPSGERSPEQAAAGIVVVATLPDSGPSGEFIRDGRVSGWSALSQLRPYPACSTKIFPTSSEKTCTNADWSRCRASIEVSACSRSGR
jgi:NAD(P)-dependent dehydrogenase (short-subunit alcohol dehydrogenase family)